jgi:hypothetical protein
MDRKSFALSLYEIAEIEYPEFKDDELSYVKKI